ncbi:MAG: hypothetical protein SWX82_32700 [Cyanobacteriota bacterium]|nr:hypothetical protein [Cyanobacteriota bacterium]
MLLASKFQLFNLPKSLIERSPFGYKQVFPIAFTTGKTDAKKDKSDRGIY